MHTHNPCCILYNVPFEYDTQNVNQLKAILDKLIPNPHKHIHIDINYKTITNKYYICILGVFKENAPPKPNKYTESAHTNPLFIPSKPNRFYSCTEYTTNITTHSI